MSLKLNERYPGRFNNPTAGYPQGSFKNRTAPDAKDGSYLEKDWANDKEGFFQSLLSAAGLVADGAVDSVGSSQYYSALTSIIGTLTPNPPNASTTVKGIVELATSTETQAGTDPDRAVTPLGLASRTATETRTGIAAVATQTTVNTGTDDATIVTPKKLRLGFAISFAANGYIAFPTWMGGLIVQWGQATASTTIAAFNYPFAFPAEVYQVLCSDAGVATMEYIAATSISNSQFNARCNSGTSGFSFLAIGR